MRFQSIKTISLAGLTIHQLSETALMYSRLLVGCGPRREVFQGVIHVAWRRSETMKRAMECDKVKEDERRSEVVNFTEL